MMDEPYQNFDLFYALYKCLARVLIFVRLSNFYLHERERSNYREVSLPVCKPNE